MLLYPKFLHLKSRWILIGLIWAVTQMTLKISFQTTVEMYLGMDHICVVVCRLTRGITIMFMKEMADHSF